MTESVHVHHILANENTKGKEDFSKKKKGESQNVQSLFSIPDKYKTTKDTPKKTPSKHLNPSKKIKIFGDEQDCTLEISKPNNTNKNETQSSEPEEDEDLIRDVRKEKVVDYKEDLRRIKFLYNKEKPKEDEEQENLIREVRKEKVVDYQKEVNKFKTLYKRKENPVEEENLVRKIRKEKEIDTKNDFILKKMKDLYQKKSKFYNF